MRAPPPEAALAGPGRARGLRREGKLRTVKRCSRSSSPPLLPLLNASHFSRPPGPVPSLRGWRLRAARCGRCLPALRHRHHRPLTAPRLCRVPAPELPRQNARGFPCCPPWECSGDVLADEFSPANVLQDANVKLAAAKNELKSGDHSC